MKNLLYTIGLLCLFATIGCKDDESGTPQTGSKGFNWENHEGKTGMMEDKGTTSLVGEEDSHYNYAFQITDGTPPSFGSLSFNLYLEAFSAGTSEFETGTFTWFHPFEYEESELEGENGFWGAIYVDGNGDGDIADITKGDFMHEVMGGTITVSGTSPNYTIQYNLTFSDNKTLSGSYSGNFIAVD